MKIFHVLLKFYRGRDHMVVGFTTTCAIYLSPLNCEFELCSWRDVLNTTLCYKVCQ